ncbi:hypothetical protein [Candidatus Spyradosoma sp. SGI.093]|uniref:hypothetical protein n=1 Tax=Candidatus Spyradosoma sp. SGI.093 TaxID=3420583 RepID=UPI003D06D478
MPSIILGNQEKIVATVTYKDVLGDDSSGTITYSQKGSLKTAVAEAPALGTKSELFPDDKIILLNRSFSTSGNGELIDVTLSYGVKESQQQSSENEDVKSYSLKVNPASLSMLLHPKLKDKNAKTVAKKLLSGWTPADSVIFKEKEGTLILSKASADDERAVPFQIVIDKYAKDDKIVAAVLAGKKTFKGATCTYSQTSYKNSISGLNNGVGDSDAPDGPNPGGKWIYYGAEASKTENDNYWKVTKNWKTVSEAEFDESVYKGEEKSSGGALK